VSVAVIDGVKYFVIESSKAITDAAKAFVGFAIEVTDVTIDLLKKSWEGTVAAA